MVHQSCLLGRGPGRANRAVCELISYRNGALPQRPCVVGVAIGHFDFSDLVAVNGIVAGARALNLPVMVGVSEGDAPFIGVRQATALVRAASRSSNCQSRTIRGPRKTSSYRDFVRPWATPFCASVGVFAVAMFAYLSATYAAYECEEPALREDFRSHAIASAISTGVMAGVVLLLSVHGAPIIWRGLTNRIWIWPLFWMTAILALAALDALWKRQYRLAHFCAAGEVSLILWDGHLRNSRMSWFRTSLSITHPPHRPRSTC
jgi:Cytochrome bd terminal oxidase subunit II